MSNSKPLIALLVGGTSPERNVSKMSGESVYGALQVLGYPTVLIDPAYGAKQPTQSEQFFSEEDIDQVSNQKCVEALNSELFDNIDLAFSVLHGKWGEDGIIQSLLELRGINYTGSKVLASALSMDKMMSKILFEQFGIRTPKWTEVGDDQKNFDALEDEIKSRFDFPCVVKPNDQGSTVGLNIVKDSEGLSKSVQLAFKYSKKVLVEEYIKGREVTVAILGNEALPVLEIIPHSGFYDYESKYTSGKSDYIVPADIPEDTFKETQQIALSAFEALGCEGYGRVDFRLSDDNKPYCLEVNTLPGMTSTSLVPKMAKAVGISFEELIDRIIKQALKWQKEKEK